MNWLLEAPTSSALNVYSLFEAVDPLVFAPCDSIDL